MNPALKKIWNAVMGLLVFAVVVVAVLLAGVRLVGITPYAVLSGSMEPAFPVGSMIYVRAVDPDSIQVGDPITFFLSEDTIATHRVIAVDEEGFHTKGDANDSPDGGAVAPENVIGKALFCIPKFGYLSSWISQPPGLYLVGIGVVAVLVLMFIPELLDAADAADRRAAKKKEESQGK